MIIVSGTERSGTSMWMQILSAAGLPMIAEAYPSDWAKMSDANKSGFWESDFREGVYYKTNPDPINGVYWKAEDYRRYAVKVFCHGLIRTERAYIDRVLLTVRPWREFAESSKRLNRLDGTTTNLPLALHWWCSNFFAIDDCAKRGYDMRIVTYDQIMADPEGTTRQVCEWLGGGDATAASAVVDSGQRTFDGCATTEPDFGFSQEFGDFYEAASRSFDIGLPFINQMRKAHETILPAMLDLAKKESTNVVGRNL